MFHWSFILKLDIPCNHIGNIVPHCVIGGASVAISFPAPLSKRYHPSDRKLSLIAMSESCNVYPVDRWYCSLTSVKEEQGSVLLKEIENLKISQVFFFIIVAILRNRIDFKNACLKSTLSQLYQIIMLFCVVNYLIINKLN